MNLRAGASAASVTVGILVAGLSPASALAAPALPAQTTPSKLQLFPRGPIDRSARDRSGFSTQACITAEAEPPYDEYAAGSVMAGMRDWLALFAPVQDVQSSALKRDGEDYKRFPTSCAGRPDSLDIIAKVSPGTRRGDYVITGVATLNGVSVQASTSRTNALDYGRRIASRGFIDSPRGGHSQSEFERLWSHSAFTADGEYLIRKLTRKFWGEIK